MLVFAHLHALAEFRKRHLPFLTSIEDHDLVREIGHYQVLGAPITLKQLLMLGVGSVATVQRRLQRLKGLGVIQQSHSQDDRRVFELTLSPACMKAFAKYEMLLAEERKSSLSGVRAAEDRTRHVCALCEGDASVGDVAVDFIQEGLRKRQRCLLIGSRSFRDGIMAKLGRRGRAAAADLAHCGDARSPEAVLEFVATALADARAAGRTARAVGDLSWQHGKMDFEALMDYETRLDPLLRKYRTSTLCEYDVRRFSGAQVLHALKCHPDTGRYPLKLG